MGRVRPSLPRHRLPLHRRVLADPAALRRWLLVAALALSAASITWRVVAAADGARADWGTTRAVLVTERAVAPGDPVAPVVERRWPVALAPPDALDAVPPDARAAGPLDPGVPLTASAVVADGRDPDRARLALPAGADRLPLEPGDRVDVWTTVDPSLTGTAPRTRRVAADVTVVIADVDTVVVAVDRTDVAALAEAVALATITLVATP